LGHYVSFRIPDGGFAIWVKYLDGIDTSIVSKKAAEMGLSAPTGSDYWYVNDSNRSFVRLGFASLNQKEMENAVEILAKAMKRAN
jgi:GntR family transcriptional regulator/MocR family aminotransferase